MRFSTRRLMVGTAVLMAGIIAVTSQSTPLVAADPEDTIKALVEQDIKNIQTIMEKTTPSKNEIKGVRSNTYMIAYLAQSQMGKSPEQDKKLATLRDQALEIAKLLDDKKNFKKLAVSAKSLAWLPEADPKVKVAPVKIEKEGDYSLGDLMHQFQKTTTGGLGTEADIRDLAKAKKLSEADLKKLTGIAARTLAVAELTDAFTDNQPTAKKKEDWVKFNKGTKEAAKELAEAIKGGKPKPITDALIKTDASCTACHNVFKK